MRKYFIVLFGTLLFLLVSGCSRNLIEVKMPADLAEEPTQEFLDQEVEAGIYEEAILCKDGSVLYKMTPKQYQTIRSEMKALYQDSFAEMIEEEDNVTDIRANEDFSKFEVVLYQKQLPSGEELVTSNLKYMGRRYSVYNHTERENIEVHYLLEHTGETLEIK